MKKIIGFFIYIINEYISGHAEGLRGAAMAVAERHSVLFLDLVSKQFESREQGSAETLAKVLSAADQLYQLQDQILALKGEHSAQSQ